MSVNRNVEQMKIEERYQQTGGPHNQQILRQKIKKIRRALPFAGLHLMQSQRPRGKIMVEVWPARSAIRTRRTIYDL